MKLDPRTDILWRTYLWYILILMLGIAIITKIIVVQTKDAERLQTLSKDHDYKVRTLEATRGNIISSDGQLLATSIPRYHVYFDIFSVDPDTLARNIDSLCIRMAEIFPKINADQWHDYLMEAKSRNDHYNPIAVNITQLELREMQKFPLFRYGR